MDITYEVCAFGVIVGGLMAGAFSFTEHRDAALWSTCIAIVLAVVGVFAYWQDCLWETDAVGGQDAQQTDRGVGLMKPDDRPAPEQPTIDPEKELQNVVANLGPDVPDDVRERLIADARYRCERRPRPSPTAVKIYFGTVMTWTDCFPYVALAQAEEDMAVLKKVGDRLAFSAKFFSENGDVVCEVVDNAIHVNRDNVFRIERTDSTLKVFNKQAKVAVSIEYLNPTAIRILGDFFLRDGYRLVMTDTSTHLHPNASVGAAIFAPPDSENAVGIWIDPPAGTTRPYAVGVNTMMFREADSQERESLP